MRSTFLSLVVLLSALLAPAAAAPPVEISLKNCPKAARAVVYQLTKADAKPVRAGEVRIARGSRLSYELPTMSVSTIAVKGR
jgi:hypothetical protein